MKKMLLGTVAFAALIVGPAMAADLGVRPVYKTPVAVPSWTGFYVGLNIGGSIGANSSTDSAVLNGPGTAPATPLGPNVLFADAFRHTPTGWVFGGQVGYNWQMSSFVVGLEADWQWTSQKDTANVGCTSPATSVFFGLGGNGFGQCLSDEQKLSNFGTLRARGGFLLNDSLWYVTGGAA
jgi:outer membrane immunogenic protein